MPIEDVITSNPVTSATQSAITGTAASTTSGVLGLAGILAKGAFGMPSGAANIALLKKQKEDAAAASAVATLEEANPTPAGMTRQEYLESQRPPMDPIERATDELDRSGVGDRDYEIDELNTYFQSTGGQEELKAFWADNPLWYNEDGTRTDYRGPNAPGTEEQQTNYDAVVSQSVVSTSVVPAVPQTVGETIADTAADLQSQITDPTLPEGTQFQFTPQELADSEFETTQGKILGAAAYASEDDLLLQAAQSAEYGIPNVAMIGQNLPVLADIETDLPEGAIIEDVDSELSNRYIQQESANREMLSNFQVYAGSSVKEQYAMLQDDWTGEGGQNKIPFYALGAVTAAKQEMAARGLGGSSMAGAAITQAGLEAMMPVAMADAQFMQTLSLKRFDMETSMGLAKLAHISQLDVMDLDFRQRKAVDTANKFFEVNMSNVNNARLVAATNNANRVQAMFSDQAAENVANNLGYTTKVETDKFYDQLSLQAQESSARMLMSTRQFNASVINSRAEFNSNMQAEIDRSNINYLRSINTANTAGINQENLINTQNLLNISNTAIANELTLQRDQLNRIFEASENVATRANNYAIAKLGVDAAQRLQDDAQADASSNALGGFLGSIAKPFIDEGIDWALDAIF